MQAWPRAQEALDTIKAKASFEVERILEIEAEVRHDVFFLTNVNEHVGDAEHAMWA